MSGDRSAVAVADVADVLSTPELRLWPYSRGLYPRDTLGRLWSYVEQAGAAEQLFFGQQAPAGEPYSWRGDLVEFVRYFDDPGKRILLIAEDQATRAIAGLVWFDDLVPRHRGAMNVFYRRRFWGASARAATAMAVRYGFEVLDLPTLWGYTPWPAAVRHAEAVGFHVHAVLPDFVLIDGQPRDLTIVRQVRGV